MTDSPPQHHPLRLLLIPLNTLSIIFAAAVGEPVLIVTLSFSLICILFNCAVYHYQSKGSAHSLVPRLPTSMVQRGYTRIDGFDEQADEALIGDGAHQYAEDNEGSLKGKPRRIDGVQRLVTFCDVVGMVLFLVLHFLVGALSGSWGGIVLEVEVATICMVTCVIHGFLAYSVVYPTINEQGFAALKNFIPGNDSSYYTASGHEQYSDSVRGRGHTNRPDEA